MTKRIDVFIFCIIFIGIGALPISCRPNSDSFKKWFSNPNNQQLKFAQASFFDIEVLNIPPQYFLDSTHQDKNQVPYLKNIFFQLTISPRSGHAKGDVAYSDIDNYAEYKARIQQLNFGMEQYLTLKTDQGAYAPVLSVMDNTYGLTDYRKFQLIFSPPDNCVDFYDSSQWELIFRDEIFESGTHSFVFEREDWEKANRMFDEMKP